MSKLSFSRSGCMLAAALVAGPSVWAQSVDAAAPSLRPVQAVSSSEAGAPFVTEDPKVSEPRIMRGNDQVIAPAKGNPRIEGVSNSFRFEEAPIAEVVRTMLGDILKADYVLHPPLNGTITLATRAPVPPDQAVFLLETALQANNLALVRDARGTYHVGRPEALKGIGVAVRQAANGVALPPGSGAIIVPLQYIGAAEMATILKPMVPPDAIVRVDGVRNLLVLAGSRTQAEGWLDIVSTFDVDLLKGMSVGVFPLKYASAKEVESALRLMTGGGAVQQGGAPSGASTQPAGRAGAGAAASAATGGAGSGAGLDANPLTGAFRILPIERINSILIVTPRAAYLDEARRWIERFDKPNDNTTEPQLFVYPVQNGNARHLAGVLAGIFGGTGSTANTSNTGVAPGLGSSSLSSNSAFNSGGFGSGGYGSGGNSGFGNTGGFGGSSMGYGSSSGFGGNSLGSRAGSNWQSSSAVRSSTAQGTAAGSASPVAMLGDTRVMADELNNAVLVWGTRPEYLKIESALKRLDLPPTQVLIEASIVEVTLADGLEYGLQWAFNGTGGRSGYSGSGQISGLDEGALGQIGRGFSYIISSASGTRAVLNALATKSLLKVISSPSLMVLDNHTAAINVGNQQPIKTSTTNYIDNVNATTSSIQYKDTGVNLIVTPSVNAGNLVTMQVDQTVTDLGDTMTSADSQPAFLQRQISSKVAVRSGESVVLGGLIRDNSKRGKAGVPFLQDVPLLGNLFGTNSVTGDRTELLVVLTPRVVRTDIDIREVSEDLRDRMKGFASFEALEDKRSASPLLNNKAIPSPITPLPSN